MTEQPSLTYPEPDDSYTAGHSGTDTSRAQASDPKRVAHVQSIVRGAVTRHADSGATIAELRRWYPEHHHGSLSSALTNLHRDGRLARLEEKRDRCHVYVAPIYVKGRATQPAVRVAGGRKKVGAQDQPARPTPQSDDLEARVEAADTALAAMATEAYEQGHGIGRDEGWQKGYDEGIDAAMKRPGALLAAKHEGIEIGRRQQAQRTINLITQMRDQMKGKGPVEAHPIGCYVRHPACALDSVRKAQEVK